MLNIEMPSIITFLFMSVVANATQSTDLLEWNRYRMMGDRDRTQLNRTLANLVKRTKIISLSRLSITDDFDRVEWLKYRRAAWKLCAHKKNRDCEAVQRISKKESAKFLPPFAIDPFLMAQSQLSRKKNKSKHASLFTFVDSAYADTKCGMTADNNTFTTSSGNKIRMDFGNHYDGQTYTITDYMLKNPDIDPQYVKDNVSLILEHNRDVIDDNKARAQEVRKLVTNNQIQWIGIELSPEQLERKGGLDGIEKRGRDLKQLLISKGVSSNDAKDYVDLYFSAGGGYYAYFNDPEVRKKVRAVSIDDEVSKLPTIKAQNEATDLYNDLRSSRANSKSMDALDKQLEESDLLRLSDQDIQSMTEDFSDPTSKQKAKNYLSLAREIERLQIRRNAMLAQNSLGQGENGIISLGSGHTDGVIKNLESSCESKSPPSKSSVTQ